MLTNQQSTKPELQLIDGLGNRQRRGPMKLHMSQNDRRIFQCISP